MLTLYFTAALALQCSVAPLTNLTNFEDSHTESGAWPFIMWSFGCLMLNKTAFSFGAGEWCIAACAQKHSKKF